MFEKAKRPNQDFTQKKRLGPAIERAKSGGEKNLNRGKIHRRFPFAPRPTALDENTENRESESGHDLRSPRENEGRELVPQHVTVLGQDGQAGKEGCQQRQSTVLDRDKPGDQKYVHPLPKGIGAARGDENQGKSKIRSGLVKERSAQKIGAARTDDSHGAGKR